MAFVTELLCGFCEIWTQFSINVQKNFMHHSMNQYLTPSLNQKHDPPFCRKRVGYLTLPCCRQFCVFSVTNEGRSFLVGREEAHSGWRGSPLFTARLFVTGIQMEFQIRATRNLKNPDTPLTR